MSNTSTVDPNSINTVEPTEIYINKVTFTRNAKGIKVNKENFSSMSRNLLFTVLFEFTEKKVDGYVEGTKIDISYSSANFKDGKKKYTAYFKNEHLKTLYTIIQEQCKQEEGKDICKTYETVYGNKIKLDMYSSFEKKLPDIDLYMKIKDLGTLHPSVVSLHYSKKDDSTIKTLDSEEFYKHIIDNPEKYTIPPDAIKLIIVLYVDHLLKPIISNSIDSDNGGSNKTRKKRQKYKK